MADDRRLDVLVRLLALVRLEAVGHEVVAVPHIDELLGQRVPAAVRAHFLRLIVVAGQNIIVIARNRSKRLRRWKEEEESD